MELIRRKSDYALRSLIFMARFPLGKKFTLRIIAKKQNVPYSFLNKIFQKLSLNKIVNSQRGPQGGYSLLKRPSQIRLKEVLESVQGRVSFSDCLLESNVCSRSHSCEIKRGLSGIQKKLINLLDKYTLKNFLNEKIYP